MSGGRSLLDRNSTVAELPDRIRHLKNAADLARGRLDIEVIAYADHVVEKAEERLTFGTHFSVVALLGATGSGKSSMANAILGDDVATTGARRPTTSSTLALVFGSEDATPLLDWLEIKNRHGVTDDYPELDGLVLLDVPDHDSVKVEHRLEMERVAEHADLLLFVTDPEKYADAALHHYLRLLGRHGAVTAIILNKADTLTNDQLKACRTDLARLLLADGVGNATVLTASATAGLGIGELRKMLGGVVNDKQLALARLDADATVAASDLAAEVGPRSKHKVAKKTAEDLAEELVAASSLSAVTDAAGRGYRRDAAAAMGWPVTRWVRKLRPHPLRRLHLGRGSTGPLSVATPGPANQARVAAAVRRAAERSTEEMPEPWPSLVRNAALANLKPLHSAVDATIAQTVRDRTKSDPSWWSPIKALQGLLFVAMLIGLVWLTVLAAVSFFALGDVIPSTIDGFPIPIPSALALGGALLGWLLAIVAGRFARIGGERRARQVERDASNSLVGVARTHLIEPIERELQSRANLIEELAAAGARWPEGLK